METSRLYKRFYKKIEIMKLLTQLRIEKRFFFEVIHFWLKLRKYNASNHTSSDIEKMQYTLLRLNHTIEKGMSMRNPRKGFGKQKVQKLLNHLSHYCDLYINVDKEFLIYPLSTIHNYILYTINSGEEIPEIVEAFNSLARRSGFEYNHVKGCVQLIHKSDIQAMASGGFSSLLLSRHSLRYFDGVPEIETIKKALELAQRTPSACNRQGWKTHVFFNEDSVRLLRWQEGCRGFEEEIRCSIIVTANLKAFFDYEVHQAYIDGGLYAMNLINALHSLGLGTIPLSMGFKYKKLDDLSKFNIPANEVPIVIIGVGKLPETFNVAISERKDISITNTFH